MPTSRLETAAVTTPTHLFVAGGRTAFIRGDPLSTVEVLDISIPQWTTVHNSPKPLLHPNMTLCEDFLYLSQDDMFFSCSVEELIKSYELIPDCSNEANDGSIWTQLCDIPVEYNTTIATLNGHVIAFGGSNDHSSQDLTGALHCYDQITNSWIPVSGDMPTPRSLALVAVLPSQELIVVGGEKEAASMCDITELA